MRINKVFPVAAGYLLGIGATFFSYRKICRLKKMISAQDGVIGSSEKQIATQKKVIADYQNVITADEAVIKTSKNYIEALELTVENNKKTIASLEEKIVFLQNSKEHCAASEPVEESSSDTLCEPEPAPAPKSSQEYIYQYDADFKLVGKYKSIKDACQSVGTKYAGAIGKVLNGSVFTAAGYFWSKGTRPLRKIPDEWNAAAQALKSEKENTQ